MQNQIKVIHLSSLNIHIHLNIHTMKAIINIKRKSSVFSYLNGHTFEVKEILSSSVAVQIPSQICEGKFDTFEFIFEEVIIVDIDNEMQTAYDNQIWGNDSYTYRNMLIYCLINKLKVSVVYNLMPKK